LHSNGKQHLTQRSGSYENNQRICASELKTKALPTSQKFEMPESTLEMRQGKTGAMKAKKVEEQCAGAIFKKRCRKGKGMGQI